MAPEAYILSAAIDGWMKKESDEEVRVRAAKAYHTYQNCGLEGREQFVCYRMVKGQEQEAVAGQAA